MGRSGLGNFERDVLLAVAHLRGAGYAISIIEEIAKRTETEPSLGSIYVTLDRLQGKGFLQSKLGPATPERGGKRKRLYEITAAGEGILNQTRKAADRMWAGLPVGVQA